MSRYIDADALRKKVISKCEVWERWIVDEIDNAPTVEQSPVIGEVVSFVERDSRPKGKWEFVQYDANPNIGNWHCTNCRGIAKPHTNFCPNCGADMRGDV